MSDKKGYNRRSFLAQSAIATSAVSLPITVSAQESKSARSNTVADEKDDYRDLIQKVEETASNQGEIVDIITKKPTDEKIRQSLVFESGARRILHLRKSLRI
ncbi:hypothetical protein [Halosimplex halobium]|uniref:hypothetical protein n=1 Tax=Halosimplex halobium TaxID=3396618 RepID=UPI003F56D270